MDYCETFKIAIRVLESLDEEELENFILSFGRYEDYMKVKKEEE